MMNSESILFLYQSIADLTSQMLSAAKVSDWDRLVEVESHCTAYVEKLKENDALILTTQGDDRTQQIALIEQILRDNQQIRALIEPNMSTLVDMIKNSSNERKLAKTYNINPGG
jgi:flagellar protein FliT